MFIHPEIREEFDEAMRHQMVYYRKMTPKQIQKALWEKYMKASEGLSDLKEVEIKIISYRPADCTCFTFCNCLKETFVKLVKKTAAKTDKKLGNKVIGPINLDSSPWGI